jgi:hypothetical protein
MGSFGTSLHKDCNAMGDSTKTSPRIPSISSQNAILYLLIIHLIPSPQIYVAIDNPSLITFVSCQTTSCYLWNYVRKPMMFLTLTSCTATAACAFLTFTYFMTGSKLPEFAGIVVSASANEYSTKASSVFWSLKLNSHCSCHGRCPFSAP